MNRYAEFVMYVIDPRTRAPVTIIGMDDPPPEILRTLARPPVANRDGFRSWGRVTRAQIEALIRADCLPLDDDELTIYPPEQAIWSLCYEEVNVG